MIWPSDVVAKPMPILETSASSYSAGIICGSLSHGEMSCSQPAFSNWRFWTWKAKLKTSKVGLPEFSSIADLLARLLLGDDLDAELDAGLVEEFLLVLLHQVGARTGLHQHLDRLPLEALPVEGAALRNRR